MTLYKLEELKDEDLIKYYKAKDNSLESCMISYATWEAYAIFCGKELNEWTMWEEVTTYCKRSEMLFPISEERFKRDKKFVELYKDASKYPYYHHTQYDSYEEYVKSEDYCIKIIPGSNEGMCQLYSLLDNFHNYQGIFEYKNYIIAVSMGNSWTGLGKTFYDSFLDVTEGFGVVIDKLTNEIKCYAFGEDDGNYWPDVEIDYNNLHIRDKADIIAMVNELPEDIFWNKDNLIEKLWRIKF